MKDRRYLPEGARINTPENGYYTSSADGLAKARTSGAILEGTALECSPRDMSLLVDLGGSYGVIPRDEAGRGEGGIPVRDIAVITRVAHTVCFKVAALPGEAGPYAILSRRAAQDECEENYLSRLAPGDVIPAAVTHLEPFGAFVDVGCGVVSLLTVDTVSVSRIASPADRFSVGDAVSAVVRSRDPETGRIFLTHRELLGTWEENAREIKPSATTGSRFTAAPRNTPHMAARSKPPTLLSTSTGSFRSGLWSSSAWAMTCFFFRKSYICCNIINHGSNASIIRCFLLCSCIIYIKLTLWMFVWNQFLRKYISYKCY